MTAQTTRTTRSATWSNVATKHDVTLTAWISGCERLSCDRRPPIYTSRDLAKFSEVGMGLHGRLVEKSM